ncbi:MAG TPA: hypothetical protein VLM89_05040 [Phycisphaerae bacterium]|nr:hypothetical protein [Phycisphaerae bacterium]
MGILRSIGTKNLLLAFLIGLPCVGCFAPSGGDFESLLRMLLGDSAAAARASTLTIRIVNEAGSGISEEVTLEVDGETAPLVCSATEHVCDFPLPQCPQQVIAISERRTDTQGFFQGGRNFNGSDEAFNFIRGEFECGDIILYRFTETVAEAFVY